MRVLFILFIFLSTFLSAETGDRSIIDPDLYLEEITENVWIHVSQIEMAPWGKIPANGMVLKTDGQIVLIETPWTNDLTRQLVQWLEQKHQLPVTRAVITHSHEDAMGGLGWLNQTGIQSFALEKTRILCREKGLPLPRFSLAEQSHMDFNDIPLEIYYPGEGHSTDNLCIYLPGQDILFGGCLIKALTNRTLGNTADANLEMWSKTLQGLKREFPMARVVIPGHGKAGSLDLIDHTLS